MVDPNIRTVNIALGSALATIVLTIVAVVAISLFTNRGIELELESVEIALLIMTLLVCTVNFVTERTNFLKGAVHLIIFIIYIILILTTRFSELSETIRGNNEYAKQIRKGIMAHE